MSVNITAKLIWHDNSWDGTICNEPENNTYCKECRGTDKKSINDNIDIEFELKNKNKHWADFDKKSAPCFFSVNAFSKKSIIGYESAPKHLKDRHRAMKKIRINSYEVSVFPSEIFNQRYIHKTIDKTVGDYFKVLEANKSLIFYFIDANNPLSKKPVLAGVAKYIKNSSIIPWENTDFTSIVSRVNVKSSYPHEAVIIPYQRFLNTEIIDDLVIEAEPDYNFIFSTQSINNDYALKYIKQILSTIQKPPKTQKVFKEIEWLQFQIAELQKKGFKYVGFHKILHYLHLSSVIPIFIENWEIGNEEQFVKNFFIWLNDDVNLIYFKDIPYQKLNNAQISWKFKTKISTRIILEKFLIYHDFDLEKLDYSLLQLRDL